MKRRQILRTLGWAATAASVGYTLDPDEQAHVGENVELSALDTANTAQLFGEAGEIAVRNSSIRLLEVLKQGRVRQGCGRRGCAARVGGPRLTTHALILT